MCFGLLVVHFEVPKNGRAGGFFGKSGDVLNFEKLSELRGGGFDKSSGTYLHGS